MDYAIIDLETHFKMHNTKYIYILDCAFQNMFLDLKPENTQDQ